MQFMVIERFKGRDAKAIYPRLRDEGRMPDGLKYVGSWIEFEIVPVVPSTEVRAMMEPLLNI